MALECARWRAGATDETGVDWDGPKNLDTARLTPHSGVREQRGDKA